MVKKHEEEEGEEKKKKTEGMVEDVWIRNREQEA